MDKTNYPYYSFHDSSSSWTTGFHDEVAQAAAIISTPETRKRKFSDQQQQHNETRFEAEKEEEDQLKLIEDWIRTVVHQEVNAIISQRFYQPFPSSSKAREVVNEHYPGGGEEAAAAGDAIAMITTTTSSATQKLELRFLNEIPSIIYTNNKIVAKDGKPLEVALYHTASDHDGDDTIVSCSSPWSSAQMEIIVLPGDFNFITAEEGMRMGISCRSGRVSDGEDITVKLKKEAVRPREGQRPLIVGEDMKNVWLKDGVGLIGMNLSFTDNSKRTRSGKFRIAVIFKTNHHTHLSPAPAISQPFRVMDHRGEVNKKPEYPNMGDEVWRLKRIGKGGAFHTRLSHQNITTVGHFWEAYQTNPSQLRKVLGDRVSEKTWSEIVHHASKCDIHDEPNYNSVENDAMKAQESCHKENLEVGEQFSQHFQQIDLGSFIHQDNQGFEKDAPPTMSYDFYYNSNYGMGNPSTSTSQHYHYQG